MTFVDYDAGSTEPMGKYVDISSDSVYCYFMLPRSATFHTLVTPTPQSFDMDTRVSAFTLRFRALADQWESETLNLSSVAEMAIHPAFRSIIDMGDRSIPLLLNELKKRPSHWVAALHEITGENPVPEHAYGKVAEMTEAWIEWGHNRGYY